MNTRKPSAPLHKAHMVYHRDGHDLETTIHKARPVKSTMHGWSAAETMCGLSLGRVCGVPHNYKVGSHSEVTCLECLDTMRDEGSDL